MTKVISFLRHSTNHYYNLSQAHLFSATPSILYHTHYLTPLSQFILPILTLTIIVCLTLTFSSLITPNPLLRPHSFPTISNYISYLNTIFNHHLPRSLSHSPSYLTYSESSHSFFAFATYDRLYHNYDFLLYRNNDIRLFWERVPSTFPYVYFLFI